MESVIVKLRLLNSWMRHNVSGAANLQHDTVEFIHLVERNSHEILNQIARHNFTNDVDDFKFLFSKLKESNLTREEVEKYKSSLRRSPDIINEYKSRRSIIASHRKEILSICYRAMKNKI